jgi:YidC/Oxa1 family membrane protein insertase
MDRKTLLAMLLCLGVFMGWQKLYIEPRMPKNPVPGQAVEATEAAKAPLTPAPEGARAEAPVAKATHPAQTRVVSTELGDALLGDGATVFKDWNLKSYKLGISADAAAVDLKSVVHEESGAVTLAFDDPAFAYLKGVQGEFLPAPHGQRWVYEDANVRITREVSVVAGEPYLDTRFTAEFKAKRPSYAFVSVTASSFDKDPEAQDRQLIYWSDKTLERVHLKDAVAQKDVTTPVKYVGASNRYFLMTLVNSGPAEAKGQILPAGPNAGRISLVYPVTNNSITIPLKAYFGAKELQTLRRVDPALDNAVDLGWFQIIAYPLLKLLKFFYAFVGNYGIAIIILTVLLKVATFPLTYKSMKSMKEMAKLQPQLQKLREKHKDDKEALNREMMSLMKTHGYNPMAGCLPMLLQFPILIGLFYVIRDGAHLEVARHMLYDVYQNLPWTLGHTFLGMDLIKPNVYVLPPLLVALQFWQVKMMMAKNKKKENVVEVGNKPKMPEFNQQTMMLYVLPLMIGFFALQFPAAVSLYWGVSTLFAIGQQWFVMAEKK